MLPTVNLHFGLVERGVGQMAQFCSFQRGAKTWGFTLIPGVFARFIGFGVSGRVFGLIPRRQRLAVGFFAKFRGGKV
jgi:hypothetical protein